MEMSDTTRIPKKPVVEQVCTNCPMCKMPMFYSVLPEQVYVTVDCVHCGVKVTFKRAEEK
jgi:hypothetical protein